VIWLLYVCRFWLWSNLKLTLLLLLLLRSEFDEDVLSGETQRHEDVPRAIASTLIGEARRDSHPGPRMSPLRDPSKD
jgi:hypothetical protein